MPIYVLTDINSFVSFPVPAIHYPNGTSNNSLFLAGILCFLQSKHSLYCAATSLRDCGDQCCPLDFIVLINYFVMESNIATD